MPILSRWKPSVNALNGSAGSSGGVVFSSKCVEQTSRNGYQARLAYKRNPDNQLRRPLAAALRPPATICVFRRSRAALWFSPDVPCRGRANAHSMPDGHAPELRLAPHLLYLGVLVGPGWAAGPLAHGQTLRDLRKNAGRRPNPQPRQQCPPTAVRAESSANPRLRERRGAANPGLHPMHPGQPGHQGRLTAAIGSPARRPARLRCFSATSSPVRGA